MSTDFLITLTYEPCVITLSCAVGDTPEFGSMLDQERNADR